jgi:hypothetical protein
VPDLSTLNPKRFEERGRKPRQLDARVHEHILEKLAAAWCRRVLDLDVDSEASHIVGHTTPGGDAE